MERRSILSLLERQFRRFPEPMDSSYLASGRDRHHNGHIVDCLDRIAAVLRITAIVHQVQNPPLGLLEERNAYRRLGLDLDRRRLLGGPVRPAAKSRSIPVLRN